MDPIGHFDSYGHTNFCFIFFGSQCQPFFQLISSCQGPECESLAFAEVNGTRLLFVGIERLSAIAIFTFPSGSAIPEFDSFHRAGGTDRSYDQLLIDREMGDLDPEDIK